jgi:hypothetical protein
MRLSSEEKLEWIGRELRGRSIVDLHDLPRFAQIYCDLFPDAVQNTAGKYTSIFTLFNKFAPNAQIVKARCDLPPDILEHLMYVVEKVVVRLCRNCGKQCSELYCSIPCELAGFNFKCSFCGSTKLKAIDSSDVNIQRFFWCEGCGGPAAVRPAHCGFNCSKPLNSCEFQKVSHLPDWKLRQRV